MSRQRRTTTGCALGPDTSDRLISRNATSFNFLFGLNIIVISRCPISAPGCPRYHDRSCAPLRQSLSLAPPNGFPGTCADRACRVRRSCASIAPAGPSATSSLIRFTTRFGAASISPLTEPDIITMPDHRHIDPRGSCEAWIKHHQTGADHQKQPDWRFRRGHHIGAADAAHRPATEATAIVVRPAQDRRPDRVDSERPRSARGLGR